MTIVSVQDLEAIALKVRDLREFLERLREDYEALESKFKEARPFSTATKLDDLWEWIEEMDGRLHPSEPQPAQKNRAEALRALLAANDGKMLSKDAMRKMGLSKNRFSELLATMTSDIELKPYHLDRRQNVLILRSKLVPRN